MTNNDDDEEEDLVKRKQNIKDQIIIRQPAGGRTYNFDADVGGIPNVNTWDAAIDNMKKLNNFFRETINAGDTLVFPANHIYYMMGGIRCVREKDSLLDGITLVFNGKIQFTRRWGTKPKWPRKESGDTRRFLPCMYFEYVTNVKFTSSTKPKIIKQPKDINYPSADKNKAGEMPNAKFVYDWEKKDDNAIGGGIIDGGGDLWYGNMRYFYREENRPRLLKLKYCQHILVENILFRKSPYWTFYADHCQYLELRYCKCDCRRRGFNSKLYMPHSMYQLAAYNTDGFDVGGRSSEYVYMHDLEIWNQDDCIAVKGGRHMLFERIRASGLGLVIGSIGVNSGKPVVVDNVIFENCYMEDTVKGIYFKFRTIKEEDWDKGAGIKNVLVKDVIMDRPKTPVWIGPAQQADSRRFWKADPVSLLWPTFAKLGFRANPAMGGKYENITLCNILINNPKPIPTQGLGVILGHQKYQMENLCFDNVRVENVKDKCCKKYSKRLFYYMGSNPEHGIVVGNRYSISRDSVRKDDTGGTSGGNSSTDDKKAKARILNGVAKNSTFPVPGGFREIANSTRSATK